MGMAPVEELESENVETQHENWGYGLKFVNYTTL
jgi:hypothetical protein